MLKRVTLCFISYVFITNILFGQNTEYKMVLSLDTITKSLAVDVTVSIPDSIYNSSDSLYFHWWVNAYSNTNNKYTQSLLKYGLDDFYFRKDKDLASIKDLVVSLDGKTLPFTFVDEGKEIMLLSKPSKPEIQFKYILKLPKYIDGLGYKDRNYFLRNFYPKLATRNNNNWDLKQYEFRHEVKHRGYPANYNIELIGADHFQVIKNGSSFKAPKPFSMSASQIEELSINLFTEKQPETNSFFASGDKIIPLNQVFLDGIQQDSGRFISHIQQVSNLMTSYLGEYPYESYTIIFNKYLGCCFQADGLSLSKYSREIDQWVNGTFSPVDMDWFSYGLITYYRKLVDQEMAVIKLQKKLLHSFPIKNKSYIEREFVPLAALDDLLSEKDIELKYYNGPRAFFQYISSLLGKNEMNMMLRDLSSKKELTQEIFISAIEKAYGKPIKENLLNYIKGIGSTEYSIKDVEINNEKVNIILENKGDATFPTTLTLLNYLDKTTIYPIDEFKGLDTLVIEENGFENITTISIDGDGVLNDYNRDDNVFYPNQSRKRNGHHFVSLLSKDLQNYKERYFMLYPAYNDNDGFLLGTVFTNSNALNPKDLTYSIAPMYSFKNKKLLGQAWINYNKYLESDLIHNVSYSVGVKSFDMNRNSVLDYSQRYIRINPTIKLNFKHPSIQNKNSFLSFTTNIILEEYPVFESGKYQNLEFQNSTIFNLKYQSERQSTLSSTGIYLNLEQQSYSFFEKEKYLKLSGSIYKRFMYASDRNIYFRVFGGGFIQNSQRESSSFQNVFSRGSLALIHQGFNDYTYDEYYLSRQNQNKTYDNQVSMVNGGGFKTPTGSANSYGMSNNFVASVNFSANIFSQPSILKPLRIYFDIGTFSTFQGNGKFANNVIYNGGISYNINEVFAIHVPLVYSKDLGNIYKGQHTSFFSRISFSMNLHRLNLWKEPDFFE